MVHSFRKAGANTLTSHQTLREVKERGVMKLHDSPRKLFTCYVRVRGDVHIDHEERKTIIRFSNDSDAN